MWRRMLGDDAGQDLIEYALLASGISVAAIASMLALAGTIRDLYDSLSDKVF